MTITQFAQRAHALLVADKGEDFDEFIEETGGSCFDKDDGEGLSEWIQCCGGQPIELIEFEDKFYVKVRR